MNHREVTARYFARCMGCEPAQLGVPGVFTVPSPLRERAQTGYATAFPLYLLHMGRGYILSHSAAATPQAAALASRLRPDMPVADAVQAAAACFGRPPHHSVKFCFRGPAPVIPGARSLTETDWPAYLQFFRGQHAYAPDEPDPDWLPPYFQGCCRRGLSFGVFREGVLASVTDGPPMPALADEVQEIGINTLPGFRRRGLARRAASACTRSILDQGKTPIWSCLADNTASERLALSVGFVRFVELLALAAPEREGDHEP